MTGNGGGNYHITYANNLTSTINVAEITLTTENVVRGYNGDVDAAGTCGGESGGRTDSFLTETS